MACLLIDGTTVLERSYCPTGWRRDGPIDGDAERRVASGRHVVAVTLAYIGTVGRTWSASRTLDLAHGAAPLFEYQTGRGWLP